MENNEKRRSLTLLATMRKRSCSSTGEPPKLELKFSNLRKVSSSGERTRGASMVASPEELKQVEALKKLRHTIKIKNFKTGKAEKEEPPPAIRILNDDLFLLIFDFLTPKELGKVALVNRQWNSISSSNYIWKKFGSPYWEPLATNSWKYEYIQWIRRHTNRLKATNNRNKKMLKKLLDGKLKMFYPKNFFWPSYKALRESYAFKFLVMGPSPIAKAWLMQSYETEIEGGSRTTLQHSPSNLRQLSTIKISDVVIEMEISEAEYTEFPSLEESGIFHEFSGIILVLDGADPHAFSAAEKWWKILEKLYQLTGVEICVVISKSENPALRKSSSGEKVKNWTKVRNFMYEEKCVSPGASVSGIFEELSRRIFKKFAWPNYVPTELELAQMSQERESSYWVQIAPLVNNQNNQHNHNGFMGDTEPTSASLGAYPTGQTGGVSGGTHSTTSVSSSSSVSVNNYSNSGSERKCIVM